MDSLNISAEEFTNLNPSDLYPVMLDPASTKRFVANGVTYNVERDSGLTAIREKWLERFRIHSLYGRQPGEIITELTQAYASNNASKHGDVAVRLDNLIRGMKDMEKKSGPLYYVCTLFINRDGEKRTAYSLDDAEAKIKDWEESNIDSRFFLSVALAWLISTSENWLTLTRSYSELGIINLPNPPTMDSSEASPSDNK